MTLTAKGLATKRRIVEESADYLRRNDAGGATLDDIRAVTRTSKGQLFHYFPDGKEELWLEVARYEADRVIDDQQPHLAELDSPQSWDRWRQVLIARYRAQGPNCPLAALMGQLGAPGSAEVIASLLHRWEHHVRQGICEMMEQGIARPGVDPDRLAPAFIAGIQGGVSVLRSTGDTTHLEAVLDVLFASLFAPHGLQMLPVGAADAAGASAPTTGNI